MFFAVGICFNAFYPLMLEFFPLFREKKMGIVQVPIFRGNIVDMDQNCIIRSIFVVKKTDGQQIPKNHHYMSPFKYFIFAQGKEFNYILPVNSYKLQEYCVFWIWYFNNIKKIFLHFHLPLIVYVDQRNPSVECENRPCAN